MSSVTGYGIIGCGMMGHEHMHNIALLPDAQVVAIFEPDADMAAGALAIEPRVQLCRDFSGHGGVCSIVLPRAVGVFTLLVRSNWASVVVWDYGGAAYWWRRHAGSDLAAQQLLRTCRLCGGLCH